MIAIVRALAVIPITLALFAAADGAFQTAVVAAIVLAYAELSTLAHAGAIVAAHSVLAAGRPVDTDQAAAVFDARNLSCRGAELIALYYLAAVFFGDEIDALLSLLS